MSTWAMKFLRRTYEEKDTFIHRLDGRTKAAIFFWVAIVNFVFFDLAYTLLCFIATIALVFIGKIARSTLAVIQLSGMWLLVCTLVWGLPLGFPANKTVLVGPFFLEGTYFATVWTLRIAVTIAPALMFYLTTRPSDMITTLLKVGMPYKFVYLFGATLQFIPILLTKAQTVYQAQMSRGLDVNVSLGRRIWHFGAMMTPLTIACIVETQLRAIALESRGFGSPAKKTSFRTVKMNRWDYAVLAVLAFLTVGSAYLYMTRGPAPIMGIRFPGVW